MMKDYERQLIEGLDEDSAKQLISTVNAISRNYNIESREKKVKK